MKISPGPRCCAHIRRRGIIQNENLFFAKLTHRSPNHTILNRFQLFVFVSTSGRERKIQVSAVGHNSPQPLISSPEIHEQRSLHSPIFASCPHWIAQQRSNGLSDIFSLILSGLSPWVSLSSVQAQSQARLECCLSCCWCHGHLQLQQHDICDFRSKEKSPSIVHDSYPCLLFLFWLSSSRFLGGGGTHVIPWNGME